MDKEKFWRWVEDRAICARYGDAEALGQLVERFETALDAWVMKQLGSGGTQDHT